MWAIDFRNMNTAVHGLFYGKDRKDVQAFYNNLVELNTDEMDGYEIEDLMNAFDSIKVIDEINYRNIRKLDSGKYGIVIDDVEYWIINNVSEDLYMESSVMKESDDIISKYSFLPSNAINKVSEDDIDALYNNVFIEFIKGDNSILSWRGYEEIQEAFGLSEETMKSIVSYWKKLRDGSNDDKVMNESEDYEADDPKIYVGTYAKYNDGSLKGEWVNLTNFDTYEDFVDYCKKLHSDESDPEFMVQDYENYPSSWYHEAGLPTDEEFYKIQELSELDDTEKRAYAAFCELKWGDDSIENFRDHYFGEYTSDDDLGQQCVDMGGIPSDAENYFDYDSFGRDLMFDYHTGDEDETDAEGNPEDPNHYYDNDGYDQGEYESDRQVAEDFIDGVYGSINEMSKETLEQYFDYAEFGRAVYLNDLTESDGYLFWNH